MTNTRFQNKVVVITDISDRLGQELVNGFAHMGARVFFMAPDMETFKQAAQIIYYGGFPKDRVIGITGDIDVDTVQMALIKGACDTFGGIDILINHASYNVLTILQGTPAANMEKMYTRNFRTPYRLAELATPYLLSARGCIINTSSTAASVKVIENPCAAVFAASKAALDAWAKADSQRLAGLGIRINNICLGFTTDAGMDFLKLATPMRELCRISHLKIAYFFLADDERSKYITGTCMAADGGVSVAGRGVITT